MEKGAQDLRTIKAAGRAVLQEAQGRRADRWILKGGVLEGSGGTVTGASQAPPTWRNEEGT
jgi:hypothetical protein